MTETGRQTDPEAIVPGWSHETTFDLLAVGDFIGIDGAYGEVVRINGPHGPLGTPPTTDWYTLGVLYEGDSHYTTVGPKRGDRRVVSWS